MSSIDRDIEAELRSHPNGLIAFNLKSVGDELSAFKELAKTRLTPSSLKRLEELQDILPHLARADKGKPCSWETDLSRPLETVPNKGAHQTNRSGHGDNLRAEINFKWQFKPVGQYSQKSPNNRIIVLNNSSVRIRVFEGLEDSKKECVAAWDFDVGNNESPGCHFHAKYHESDEARRAIYDSIDIPRLPTIIFMPTDAIEFVIGELWQDDSKRMAVNSAFAQWHKFTRTRMNRLFEWYSHQLKGAMGSPWMNIKIAKPPILLFLDSNIRL